MKILGSMALAGVLGYLPGVSTAQAVQITLAWDASAAPNVGGYTLHYGRSSRNYTTSVDVGDQTRYPWTGLAAGTTYYFAVTVYDRARTVSINYSN